MKKIAIWLALAALVLCVGGCNKRSGSPVTPGDLATQTPYVPPVGTDASDAGEEYRERLCTYAWLDTFDMTFFLLSEDGSYGHYRDKELTDAIDSGSWQILKDGEGHLTLHMAPADGDAFDLYELDLYEESIYARGLEHAYIWLLCDPVEE